MTVSAQQRREKIIAEVLGKRHVTVSNLAASLETSEATVRRDLKALANEGTVEMVYGGVTLPRPADFSFISKGRRNVQAKQSIARLAADLVRDGDQVFLDSGTTCFALAPFIKARKSVSVILNSARLAMELDAPGLGIIMLGGQYRHDRMDFVGPLCNTTLDQLRGYTALIGADGLSMEFGPSACDIESAYLHRLAIKNARQTILLVDHTKFEAPSLYKIVDWEPINKVVTDQEPDSKWNEFFKARGIEVLWPAEITGVNQNNEL